MALSLRRRGLFETIYRATGGVPRYRVHQRLHMGFRDGERQRLLWALLPGSRVLVRHVLEADWRRAFADLPILARTETRQVDLGVDAGETYRFALEANPVRCDSRTRKRLPVPETGLLDWLRRKLADAGATVQEASVMSRENITSSSRDVAYVHTSTRFVGSLQVMDADALIRAYVGGIGPAKGFGFGMLRLSR